MYRSIAALSNIALLVFAPNVFAQNPTAMDQVARVAAIQNNAKFKAANDYVDRNHDAIVSEWSTITEINAPSGQEQERASYLEKLLRTYKLQDIHYDAARNLIAVRKGTGGGPTVAFDAHMDTVFQPGLKIKTAIRDGRIYAPGIGDDTRNIEALLATIRALDSADVKTKGDLVFVFTTEEETALVGAKHFVKENKGKVDYYVALDGGYEGFTYAGIGINWYRHHFIGPGGHTRSRTPPYSATLPLARAIERIYQLKVPTSPSSNLNIGMLGGSEVPNAKAADAWFTVDLRSTSSEVIADLEKQIAAILNEEAERAHMTLRTEMISTTPVSSIKGNRDSDLVKIAEAVHRAMGFDPPITNTGSNNSSAALQAGITSISTGAGPCDDSHALTENCEIEPFFKGIKKMLLPRGGARGTTVVEKTWQITIAEAQNMGGIKRVIGCVLIIVGVSLVGYFIFGPGDKRTLARQADYGGNSATSSPAKNSLYLIGGLACCLLGGGLVKKG